MDCMLLSSQVLSSLSNDGNSDAMWSIRSNRSTGNASSGTGANNICEDQIQSNSL